MLLVKVMLKFKQSSTTVARKYKPVEKACPNERLSADVFPHSLHVDNVGLQIGLPGRGVKEISHGDHDSVMNERLQNDLLKGESTTDNMRWHYIMVFDGGCCY